MLPHSTKNDAGIPEQLRTLDRGRLLGMAVNARRLGRPLAAVEVADACVAAAEGRR
jgi:hypothetical protein